MTVAEIAARLRLSKMTVYRLVDEGAFPGSIRAGRSIRVPLSGFEAYVKASEVGR
jgi:excisionase family DNA binding protein